MSFGIRLKELRMSRGVSQIRLGEALGVTKRTIINYEMGHSSPPITLLEKISKYFGVTIDKLVSEDEEFVAQAYQSGGSRTARDASTLVAEISGLFAGARLADEEKDAVMKSIQNAYWVAKDENRRKFTPRKYKKSTKKE